MCKQNCFHHVHFRSWACDVVATSSDEVLVGQAILAICPYEVRMQQARQADRCHQRKEWIDHHSVVADVVKLHVVLAMFNIT